MGLLPFATREFEDVAVLAPFVPVDVLGDPFVFFVTLFDSSSSSSSESVVSSSSSSSSSGSSFFLSCSSTPEKPHEEPILLVGRWGDRVRLSLALLLLTCELGASCRGELTVVLGVGLVIVLVFVEDGGERVI